ncbi:glycosyl transferase, family 4 protein [Theileria orientalis]|uniref:UDP-N-acetylglucosamine--dolichyl-phosphate N-acetylglucosaminephosphotransferase n=1 Tax=Theileria orientalis TaxID=68886 RepID=A0A976M3I5_THEOR|nr:glycosyl transferase, family 4 protein [Theileria orientalis]
MVSSARKTSYRTFRPILKFYKVFFLPLVTSSIISANRVKYHKNDFNQFIIFLIYSFFISAITYFGTFSLIKNLKKRGFVGTNLNAIKSAEKVAEPGGLLGCVVYILAMVLFQMLFKDRQENGLEFNLALVSIVIMTLLGLIDDILRLNWWIKIMGPIIASFPLCLAYSETEFSPDRSFQWLSNRGYHGRMFTYAIIVLITVFCANSINIYSGINGLEIGQSLVMAFFITIYNSMDGCMGSSEKVTHPSWERRMYTYYFTLPFIAVNASLLCFNWYPAKLFAGNVYTLFSGTFFSVITVIGELWEVLPFLMLPQLINFLISIPQLVGIVACPRHRIPKFNIKTKKLENSKNYTLLNLFLLVCGPMSEEALTMALLCLQTLCSLAGLIYKYYML